MINKKIQLEVPETLEQALDLDWLTRALAPLSDGKRVQSVELAEVIRTMASKLRIVVSFEGDPEPRRLCLKAFLGSEDFADSGGATTLREANFYTEIAPRITMRTPGALAVVTDERKRCIIMMPDLVEAGANFCSALEPFTPDHVAQTLDQIARLHAGSNLLDANPWVPCRIQWIAETEMFSAAHIQDLMNDDRRGSLPARTLDAALLLRGMKALAARNAPLPQTLLHGDCHAGNVYFMPNGPGFSDWQLVQRGHWALDVAYHINAVLPAEIAEREERNLLDSYLETRRTQGGDVPDRETAWTDYRAAQIYGFYHWAITRRVDPPITNEAFQRLGAAVTRHETYKMLDL